MRLSDFTEINPYEKLPKGTIAKKISMEQLEPYKKFVSGYSLEAYSGGAKFRNGDTIMARITPCLENGKTAFVSTLDKNEVGFGSTEYIVFRAKDGISHPDFVYYLVISSLVREPAIKSMVGSSGRQRVQQTVIDELEIPNYSLAEQQHIVDILGSIDEKIENNELLIQKIEEKILLEYDRINTFEPLSETVMSDCFDITIGKTPPRKESHWFTPNSTDVKWLSISDLGKSSVFCFDTSERITPEGISKYNVKVVPKNTVVLSFKLTVGKVAITGCDMATNEAIAHFNSSNHCLLEYVYCYLKRYNFDTLGNTSSIATAVNSKTIKAMHFFIPDDTVLENFHHKTLPLFENIRQLLIENQKLNELKQLYLKKFFG